MKDARGHGSNERGGGTARGQVYRDAVSNVQRAMGTWAQGIVEAQQNLAAHQTGIGELKTTAQMMAEHEKIWGRSSEKPVATKENVFMGDAPGYNSRLR